MYTVINYNIPPPTQEEKKRKPTSLIKFQKQNAYSLCPCIEYFEISHTQTSEWN
jgi:hypothetical protein